MSSQTGTLFGFTRLSSDTQFARLHNLLWPKTPSTSPVDLAAKPESLAAYIKNCDPGLSLWPREQSDEAAMEVEDADGADDVDDVDADDVGEVDADDEYLEFMTFAAKLVAAEIRWNHFFTGHPGTGKSVGAAYILFRLLASGQSVFFIPNTNNIYYFSGAGVEMAGMVTDMINADATEEAIRNSWVVIDVDHDPKGWFPSTWIEIARCLVWTSSPQEDRMRRFNKQFRAKTWFMKPWSMEEIAAVMILDPEVVRSRLLTSGPVARTLFGLGPDVDWREALDQVILEVIEKKAFGFADVKQIFGLGYQASHRLFLLEPLEGLEGLSEPSSRTSFTISFLSPYIADRFAYLLAKNGDRIRVLLAAAFDNRYIRGPAGKLVELMLHRALTGNSTGPPIDAEAAFGLDFPITEQLWLFDKADTFVLESHQPFQRATRPIYLRPQSQNFAAIDSIILTSSAAYLVQSAVGDTHEHRVAILLAILHRLQALGIAISTCTQVQARLLHLGNQQRPYRKTRGGRTQKG
ncbi:hypothetical protein B0H11DRAFT_2431003 [Mycena galericulata]|nr:hypothetical protein B0H11DRAFT_2431003 [Mycena galericulata]